MKIVIAISFLNRIKETIATLMCLSASLVE